jgi:hypothetical protein
MAVTMKNAVFWDVAPYRYYLNRRFGGTYQLQPPAHAGSSLADFSTLNIEAIRSPETSVQTRSTRRHIPEDGILQKSKMIGQLFLKEPFYYSEVSKTDPNGVCELMDCSATVFIDEFSIFSTFMSFFWCLVSLNVRHLQLTFDRP